MAAAASAKVAPGDGEQPIHDVLARLRAERYKQEREPMHFARALCEGLVNKENGPLDFEVALDAELNNNGIKHAPSLDLILCGMQSGEVQALDPASGRVTWRAKMGDVLVQSLEWVDAAGRGFAGMKNGVLHAFSGDGGRLLSSVELSASQIWQLTYAPAERVLAACTFAGDVCVLDPFSDDGVALLCKINLGSTMCLSVCPNGRGEVLASSMDGKVSVISLPLSPSSHGVNSSSAPSSPVKSPAHCPAPRSASPSSARRFPSPPSSPLRALHRSHAAFPLAEYTISVRRTITLGGAGPLLPCSKMLPVPTEPWIFATSSSSCEVLALEPHSLDIVWRRSFAPIMINGLAHCPVQRRLFVGLNSGELVGLDPISGALTFRLKLTARGVCGVCYADGAVYAGAWSGVLCKVDPTVANMRKVVDDMPSATLLRVQCYVPSERRLYVGIDTMIVALEPRSCAVMAQMNFGANVVCLAYAPAARMLYAGLEDGSFLTMDLALVAVRHEMKPNTQPIYSIVVTGGESTEATEAASSGDVVVPLDAPSPGSGGGAGTDDAAVYALLRNGLILLLEPRSSTVRTTIDLGAPVFGSASTFACSGGRLYAGLMTGDLVTVDMASHTVVHRTGISSKARQTITSVLAMPDENRIYVGYLGGLASIDATTLEVAEQLFSGKRVFAIAWAATQRQLLIGTTDGEIVALAAKGGEVAWRVLGERATMIHSFVYIDELQRLFVAQGGQLSSEPVSVNSCSTFPGVLRPDAAALPWAVLVAAGGALPMSAGGASFLHGAAMLDDAALSSALLRDGAAMWLHDASGAAPLDRALAEKAYRALAVLVAAAAADDATAAVWMTRTDGAETLAVLASLGEARVGELGPLMGALTRRPFGEVPTNAAVEALRVYGLWGAWPSLTSAHEFPPRAGRRAGRSWRAQLMSLFEGEIEDTLAETRCVALPDLARSRALLHAVTTSEDDSFIESMAVQALVQVKWTGYALPVLIAQATLHVATFVALHAAPHTSLTKALLGLLCARQLGMLIAEAVGHHARGHGPLGSLVAMLRLRTCLTCVFIALLLLALLEYPSVTDAASDADVAYMARTVASVTKIFFWWRFVYFLRLVGTLSALLKMLEHILLDVRPFALLMLFTMGAAADSLHELQLLQDLPRTIFNVYSVASFGADLPSALMPDGADGAAGDRGDYQPWAIAIFFVFSFIGSVVMMNFIVAVMGDTFERVQERQRVLAIKERAALVQDVDSCLPTTLLRRLNPRFVLYCTPATDAQQEAWSGFFGEIKKEVGAIRAEVAAQLAEQRKALAELRAGQKELLQQTLNGR